jgi:hypothetical protein
LLDLTFNLIESNNLPNIIPDMRNLWPFRLLSWKIVMCVAAPHIKRKRNTAATGTSRATVGTPPSDAVAGGYGGPVAGIICP